MEKGKTLYVVIFPWLAMGHFIPFLELSKHLARKGHKVSFISSPRNIQKLPKIPQDLASLIELVSIPLQRIENLPGDAESSMDVPRDKQRYLKMAFDLLQSPITDFLEETKPKPDWIIIDYASHWLPPIASRFGISTAFFSLFTAATLAFFGPPSILLNGEEGRSTAESFTVVPDWIPFPSNVTFRLHEMIKSFEDSFSLESVVPDTIRFAISIQESNLVVIRTSVEFEPEWFGLIRQLYKKPVLSLGVLPPSQEGNGESGSDEKWLKLKGWLDKQNESRVVYVALGTEATLTEDEIRKMALGLEQSELPFLWVLRKPLTSAKDVLEMLPDGFMEIITASGRGIVCTEWVPQVKILSHPALGAFLTHCGWNSVIEALGFGRVLVLFPLINEQGLNARLLEEKQVGVEIPRRAEDGFFTSNAVADTLRLAVLSDKGEYVRATARGMKSLFGDCERNQSYMDDFVRHLEEVKSQKTSYQLSE